MKTKFKSSLRIACHSFGGVVCAGAVILIISNARAQNLFVSDIGPCKVYEFTPGGTQSTFASGFSVPYGLAFDSAGNLFVSDYNYGNGIICEYTPGGTRSTFASGLSEPSGLAFDNADNLFVSGLISGSIYEYTPGGTQTVFASGLQYPTYLAFQPVPEPSALGLLTVGTTALLVRRRRN